MSAPERANNIGHLTARNLLDSVTELREDIQLQSIALAEIDLSLRNVFNELRRLRAAVIS